MKEQYEEVTDPELLASLNHQDALSKHIKSFSSDPKSSVQPESTLKTLGHSAFNAAPEAIGNLMLKLGLTSPKAMQEALYGIGEQGIESREAHERGVMAHPISSTIGSLLGFGPLGFGTSQALRSIPFAGKVIKAASPSLLKRTGVHALEGGTIGSLYSPPGQEAEEFGLGALIGGALGGPGVSLARSGPSFVKNFRNIANIEELGAKRNQAQQANIEQNSLIDAMQKRNIEENAGFGTPEGITRGITQREGKIEQLKPSANTEQEPTENLLNWPTGEESLKLAEKNKKDEPKMMRHYLRQGLNENESPDVELAKEINSNYKNKKQYIQKEGYNYGKEWSDKNYLSIPRKGNIKLLQDEIKKYKNDPKMQEILRTKGSELFKQPEGKDLIKGSDFIAQWQDTNRAAGRAWSRGYKEGEPDQLFWRNKAEELQELSDKQLKILEQQLPSDIYKRLKWAQKAWREEIIPFRGNKVFEQARNLGRVDVPNIPEELRGEGRGQEKMKEFILSNPRLTRLALANSHSENPTSLLNPKPSEYDFINKLPSLQGMANRLKENNNSLEIAKAYHEAMKSNRYRTEGLHKDILNKQLERQKSIQKINKYENEIKSLTKKKENLEKEYKRGIITKQEFENLDEQYKEAMKNKKVFLRTIKKTLLYGGAAALGVQSAIKNLLNK